MTTYLSQKNIARVVVFVIVMAIAMSISFLVQAHDVPDAAAAAAPSPSPAKVIAPVAVPLTDVADGLASWYGGFFHGRRTASGQRYDMDAFTAAHRTLPFGTLLRVRNVETGKIALVEITDRGPFIRRRVVDLSRAAARFLGVSVTPVAVDAITKAEVTELMVANPGAAIVLDDEFQPHTIASNNVTVVAHESSLKAAVTSRQTGEYLQVSLNERGTYSFARVTVGEAQSPLLAGR